TGTCFKLTTKEPDDRFWLAAFLFCKYGQALQDRLKTNLLVSYIAKGDLYGLPVPHISSSLRDAIKSCFDRCFAEEAHAKAQLRAAETTLLQALGLTNWQPPQPLSYARSHRDVFAAGRLDAEYFAPLVAELLQYLRKGNRKIGDVAPARHERFTPAAGVFNYIEIGGVRADGTALSETLEQSEAPSRATWHVHGGDIITSTVRPARRLSALIAPEQSGDVCSSGFVVLEPKHIAPEVLLTYLRLPPVCELLDLHTSASLYPTISEQDLLNIPFPNIDAPTAVKVAEAVRAAQAMRQQAAQLLEAAKRAVEIAIEDSESAALAFMESMRPGLATQW
ncbi:MAG TPA: hypothetical protein PLL18_07950, partial [Flavobacteriales bacterium]|nr:hypothetical protein [Flavobacteriales bacterium]